ncbi:hypothetical protein SLEP1_g11178 [Rubroshorea leprosula]|uniref:Uncharacterized protein n=1 Tax=Rubroshorea leprosula TaxID=152421 RepID=A0AAV5IF07_9ROSI|nr:hypothetical protein SLEP1_g11178 [Rubroshorea leprosula]
MSRMKSDRKPPLPKSPVRVRPRRVLGSNSTALQTPPGSLTKSQKPIRSCNIEESEIRPEYQSISCELRALAKMVRDEFGGGESENAMAAANNSLSANSTPLFERGRFYDEYSARRNERLKRKKGETGNEPKTAYKLGVTVESSKRRDSKKLESLRKSVSAAYSVERSENPRYMLRSMSKENKKPPLALAVNNEKPVIGSGRKTGVRRVR